LGGFLHREAFTSQGASSALWEFLRQVTQVGGRAFHATTTGNRKLGTPSGQDALVCALIRLP